MAMRNRVALLLPLLTVLCFNLASALRPRDYRPEGGSTRGTPIPTKRLRGLGELFNERDSDSSKKEGEQTPIKYGGGKLLTDPLNIYLIFYGKWGQKSDGADIIINFIKSMSDVSVPAPSVANWWNISTAYFMTGANGAKKYVSPKVSVSYAIDSYSNGAGTLTQPTLEKIVQHNIFKGSLPLDPTGIYAILSSPDIDVDGLCTKFCGFHDKTVVRQKTVYYAIIGHHGRCMDSCAKQSKSSPNGNPGVDAMVSTLAHEITEAATDPDLGDGWVDAQGEENADKCGWTYDPTMKGTDANGQPFEYNVVGTGGVKYLVQLNWDPNRQACVRSLGVDAPVPPADAPSPGGIIDFGPSPCPGGPTSLPPSAFPPDAFGPSAFGPDSQPPSSWGPSPFAL